MKVGTDGVLLGAWAASKPPLHVLDIGAGTGVISLMLAQRFPKAQIKAIEINGSAYIDLERNVKECRWSQRIQTIQSAIQEWDNSTKFDLIVSNPPYFSYGSTQMHADRKEARSVNDLSFEVLLQQIEKRLTLSGTANLIIPFESEKTVTKLAQNLRLYPFKITRVKGKNNTPIKRSLVAFSRNKNAIIYDEIVIEIDRHVYTRKYTALVSHFYLKM